MQSPNDVERRLTAGARRFVPAGGTLIEQGIPVVFILLKGKLFAWLKPRRGPEREIARLNAGSWECGSSLNWGVDFPSVYTKL